MNSEYADHVRRSDMEYLMEYEKFEASLSVADRELLARSGASAPDLPDHRALSSRRMVLGVDRDVAESSAAAFSPDVAEELDTPEEQLAELAGITLEQARIVVAWGNARAAREVEQQKAWLVVKVGGAFINAANSKLLAAGLAFAADLQQTSGMGTMQDYARTISVSRAAISKVAKWWKQELELPDGAHMRDEAKCRSYSNAQKQKHYRKVQISLKKPAKKSL